MISDHNILVVDYSAMLRIVNFHTSCFHIQRGRETSALGVKTMAWQTVAVSKTMKEAIEKMDSLYKEKYHPVTLLKCLEEAWSQAADKMTVKLAEQELAART